MIKGFSVLLLFQLLGEFLAVVCDLPIPGPVIGLVLLLIYLVVIGHVPKPLNDASKQLIPLLPLLLLPPSVGVLLYWHLLADSAVLLLASLIISVIVSLIVISLSMKLLLRKTK